MQYKNSLIREKPVINRRHRLMEFGTFQPLSGYGERKNRNNAILDCKKGYSLF
jgi:hypothetical protein